MASSALRSSILRRIRIPVSQTLTLNGSTKLGSVRFMSSHDDHLDKEEVTARVLDVVKSFPKVDPAKVLNCSGMYTVYAYIWALSGLVYARISVI
nr:acyl carrier protein 1, mitochondrial-like [Coffea arabica]